jgi:uncharacterized membrane-anchored protein YitT (DUF2179 family)
VIKKIFHYAVIVVVALLMATSYQLFVFPNSFAPAGINGICTMIQHLFGVSIGYLSLLINLPLAIAVFFLISRPTAIRSMLYCLCFSGFTLVLEQIDLSAFVYATANSALLGPAVAGLIAGTAGAILHRVEANVGGTDFVAALIYKYHPQVNFFWVVFALNISVAIVSYFVYSFKMEPVLLCIIYSYASSTVRDRFAQKSRSAVRCEIVTDHPNELGKALIDRLHHSATVIPAKGMYSGRKTHMLVCVVNQSQVAALNAVLKDFPGSFAITSQVANVTGNFKRLDSHGMPEWDVLGSVQED